MAEFDAQAILDTFDAGATPDTWKIYHARKSYLLGQGLFICCLGLLMLVCSGLLCAMGIFIVFIPQHDLGATIASIILVLVGLGFIVLSATVLWAGVSLWWQIRTLAKQALILTPGGFVARTAALPTIPLTDYDSPMAPPAREWTGASTLRIYTVAYSQARTVTLVIRQTRAEAQIERDLSLTTPNPRYKVRWLVDPRFGAPDTIAQSIIEAHMRYKAQHSEAQ